MITVLTIVGLLLCVDVYLASLETEIMRIYLVSYCAGTYRVLAGRKLVYTASSYRELRAKTGSARLILCGSARLAKQSGK